MSNTQESKQLMAFGRRLADVRKSRGLTQQQLAEKLSISLVSIGYIETGKRWPRLVTLHRISAALGVRLEELFKGL
ncbi:MAG TPA: helix-turn-helix transcriptional regulator [Candidatus Saccharimonadia bacterium]|nr:helix-turn-helix transcriptional regulator [Candidatus Saccharimonadia bacterium]